MLTSRRSSRRMAAAMAVLIMVIAGVEPATAAPPPPDRGAQEAEPELLMQLGDASQAPVSAMLARVGADGKPSAQAPFTCDMDQNADLYESIRPWEARYMEYYVTVSCTIAMSKISILARLWSNNNPSGPGAIDIAEQFIDSIEVKDYFYCEGDGKCIGHWIYHIFVEIIAPPDHIFFNAEYPCQVIAGGAILSCSADYEGDVTQ